MAKLSDLLPAGNFLKASDLPEGAAVKLVIDKIVVETIKNDDGESDKPVLYFKNKEKGFVLNSTNLKMLVALFGDDIDAPCTETVVLYRTMVDFRGQMVPALRLRGVDQGALEDDVPF